MKLNNADQFISDVMKSWYNIEIFFSEDGNATSVKILK